MIDFLICVAILVPLCFSLYFFWKSSGTFELGQLNLVSVTCGLFFLQTFLGISLVMLGLDKHYTLDKLFDRERSIIITFVVVMVVAIIFPLCIYGFLKLFKVNPQKEYKEYLKKTTEYLPSKLLFILICGACVVCVGLLIGLFAKIGYIPLVKMFIHSEEFDMSIERIRISNTYIIHPYVTNMAVHLGIPVISYFTFTCALASRQKRWYALAALMFASAILAKTYNFAKASLLFYIMVFVFIYIYFVGGIKRRWMIAILAVGFTSFFAIYLIFGVNTPITDIYNGVMGRVFFTQVGTLSYNFDLFPGNMPFLMGMSFSKILLPLFGLAGAEQLRSARLLMEIYGSEGVYKGNAGVMNSLFIGEAYANFGWVGIIISVIWVALIIALFFTLALRMKKTPATVTLFAYFTVNIATTTQGGFVDFVYNTGWIVIIFALLVCHFIPYLEQKRLKKQEKSQII